MSCAATSSGYFKTQDLIQAIRSLDGNASQPAIRAGATVNAVEKDGQIAPAKAAIACATTAPAGRARNLP